MAGCAPASGRWGRWHDGPAVVGQGAGPRRCRRGPRPSALASTSTTANQLPTSAGNWTSGRSGMRNRPRRLRRSPEARESRGRRCRRLQQRRVRWWCGWSMCPRPMRIATADGACWSRRGRGKDAPSALPGGQPRGHINHPIDASPDRRIPDGHREYGDGDRCHHDGK